VPAGELAATVVRELVRRTGLEPGEIDDVIFGQVYPNSEAPAIGRIAALDAGLGVEVPGYSSTAAAARACRRSSTPR
jgi:acetyl-CoA C-acetyltransferase